MRLVVAIFMAPFLLANLGSDVYGIIPLVNSCVAFLVVASGGIQSAVGRFATMYTAKNEPNKVNQYVSTAFFMLLFICGLLFVPFLWCTVRFADFFSVPVGFECTASLVFFLLGINLLVVIIMSPLTVGIHVREHFAYRNIVVIFVEVLRPIIIVVYFVYIDANVVVLALSVLLSTLISESAAVVLSKRALPTLSVSIRSFDREKIKEILPYSSWVLISQMSSLIFLNTDYIIINKLLGSSSVTDYSLVARWALLIRGVVVAAVGVITPVATKLDVMHDCERLRSLVLQVLRLVVVVLIPCCILLTLFSKELLTVWVGEEFAYVSPVFWASVLPLCWLLASSPIFSVLNGMGKVKMLAIINLISAGINLMGSFIFIIYFDMGIFGVALATSFAIFVKNYILLPIIMKKTIGVGFGEYVYTVVKPFIAALPLIVVAVLIKEYFILDSWLYLGYAIMVCLICYSCFVYVFLLTKDEKLMISNKFH